MSMLVASDTAFIAWQHQPWPGELLLPVDGWTNNTAYNTKTHQAQPQDTAPNAAKRIWLRDEPGCEPMYQQFLSDIYALLGERGSDPALFPCQHLTWLRYEAGDSVKAHMDHGGVVMDEGRAKRASYTALWYFSDEQLKGGDLIFPEHGIHCAAGKGRQIVFAASETHQVSQVVRGTRLALLLRLWQWE